MLGTLITDQLIVTMLWCLITSESIVFHTIDSVSLSLDMKSRDVETQAAALRLARRLLRAEPALAAAMLEAGLLAPLLDALDRNW